MSVLPVFGDIPEPGEDAFVGDMEDTDAVGKVVNPTRVWHLLRMARRNSLWRWLLSGGSNLRASVSKSSFVHRFRNLDQESERKLINTELSNFTNTDTNFSWLLHHSRVVRDGLGVHKGQKKLRSQLFSIRRI